jgi:hypothetical protein
LGSLRIFISNNAGLCAGFAPDPGTAFLSRIALLADKTPLKATKWSLKSCGANEERYYSDNLVPTERRRQQQCLPTE